MAFHSARNRRADGMPIVSGLQQRSSISDVTLSVEMGELGLKSGLGSGLGLPNITHSRWLSHLELTWTYTWILLSASYFLLPYSPLPPSYFLHPTGESFGGDKIQQSSLQDEHAEPGVKMKRLSTVRVHA